MLTFALTNEISGHLTEAVCQGKKIIDYSPDQREMHVNWFIFLLRRFLNFTKKLTEHY